MLQVALGWLKQIGAGIFFFRLEEMRPFALPHSFHPSKNGSMLQGYLPQDVTV